MPRTREAVIEPSASIPFAFRTTCLVFSLYSFAPGVHSLMDSAKSYRSLFSLHTPSGFSLSSVRFPNLAVPLSFDEVITTLLAKEDSQMWIAKGVLLGFGLFVGGLFLLVVLSALSAIVKGSVQYNQATGIGVLCATVARNGMSGLSTWFRHVHLDPVSAINGNAIY
jgi:hypothetical protein